MHAMAAANEMLGMATERRRIGLLGHAFSEQMQGSSVPLVGNSTISPPSLASLAPQPASPPGPLPLPHLCAAILVFACRFCTYLFRHSLLLRLSTSPILALDRHCKPLFHFPFLHHRRRSPKFCSITIRHLHAFLDGLSTHILLYSFDNSLGHNLAKFFRHDVQFRLHHLGDNRES